MPVEQTKTHQRVVVVGGGVAALEAVLALDALARKSVTVTVIAPESEFVLRPLDVARPFSRGHSDSLDLESFMAEHTGLFRRTAMLEVNSARQAVLCSTGPDEPYDQLIVAVGASTEPAFEHVLTFGSDLLKFNGLLADLEEGYSKSVAFVVPDGSTWPMPLYELALMAADEVTSMGMDEVALHFVTPEHAPLEAFGSEASDAVARLLKDAGIEVHCDASPQVSAGRVDLGEGHVLDVARIVALPKLSGPHIRGLPGDANGFIPVDGFGRIAGLSGAYAVGDAANHQTKQGGLACQQADVAASHIAQIAGEELVASEYEPVLRGRLLTAGADRFLRRDSDHSDGEVSMRPLWSPPSKVAGHYLSPYLEARGIIKISSRSGSTGAGVDVELVD